MNGSILSPMAISYPARASACGVPASYGAGAVMRWGVPRVVGWDPVYDGPGLVYEGQGQYIMRPGQYNEARTNNIVLEPISAKEAISWKTGKMTRIGLFSTFY